MRYLPMGHESARPAVLATVTLLGLALVLCLAQAGHCEAGMDMTDMAHGACGAALAVSLFTAGVVLASPSWWLLPGLTMSAYAVSLHLSDPPPKSPALR